MTFLVSDELRLIVAPGALWLDGATVREGDSALDAPLAAAIASVKHHPPAEVASVRTMYKRVGIDPTRTRPSSEALLRRVRKGDSFPRINTMVDVCNWCSLEFQLPYGLYDAARITGDTVTMRIGAEGESYPGIRKDEVHVAGRIALADDVGPFGNPTSDSARTMVTVATTRALVIVFGPPDLGSARLRQVVDLTAERMRQFTGARETGRTIALGG
ncbi:MAG: phenylalanine--tRNA ligase beta subunit-related protein [Vicinamibacterales bacterium]